MTGAVLYVDDEAANLVVFESALRADLPVLTARSGAEALALLRTHDVAVLLTDQRMPGMTGVELIEMVSIEFPETRRMLVTAYSDLDAAISAINRGRVHHYIRKPWEPVALRQTLAQAREGFLSQRRVDGMERRLLQTERMYALGVIAAGIAHEIRNPLSALAMDVELVHEVLRGPLTPPVVAEARETLRDASQAVRAIRSITESVEASTRARPDGAVDLREVVTFAQRAARGEARRVGRVVLELAEVSPVRGSSTRLGQVVLNLLVNALEAFDPARQERNEVRLRLGQRDGWVELTVSDNGPGIAPGVLPRIFDPLFTTKGDGGTGLGLAISRQIVLEQAGTLAVESTPGEGTTFRVRLPVAET